MSVAFLYHHPIKSFVNLGEIFECGFEVFENRKMLITFDRMLQTLSCLGKRDMMLNRLNGATLVLDSWTVPGR